MRNRMATVTRTHSTFVRFSSHFCLLVCAFVCERRIIEWIEFNCSSSKPAGRIHHYYYYYCAKNMHFRCFACGSSIWKIPFRALSSCTRRHYRKINICQRKPTPASSNNRTSANRPQTRQKWWIDEWKLSCHSRSCGGGVGFSLYFFSSTLKRFISFEMPKLYDVMLRESDRNAEIRMCSCCDACALEMVFNYSEQTC